MAEVAPGVATGRFEWVLQTALGHVLLRPWFDRVTLGLLTRWYFPLSRAWAAALAACGQPERFFARVPERRRTDRLVPAFLDRIEARRDELTTAEARWEEAFFGAGPALSTVERARRRASTALMMQRSLFVPMHVERPFPAVAWDIEDQQSVARRHGIRLRHPELAFAIRGEVHQIEASRAFTVGGHEEGWLRFPSPVSAVGGHAWARVFTPAGARATHRPPVPSLIFAHGIGMEPEHWGGTRDPLINLVQTGMRVIRPEAPWHGRRRRIGYYGGEPILAWGVGGLLDFFHASVLEIGALVAWARATRRGPVAVGGVSLGALTAQLVATAAARWPAQMRPDALFLVAPSKSMMAVAFEGSLSRGVGVPQALRQSGWTAEQTAPWLELVEPCGMPAVPSEHIVVVLGEADDVTLTEGGEDLVASWRVPPENVFRCSAGHFSTSLGLSRDGAPIARLLAILRRLR